MRHAREFACLKKQLLKVAIIHPPPQFGVIHFDHADLLTPTTTCHPTFQPKPQDQPLEKMLIKGDILNTLKSLFPLGMPNP